MGVKAFATLNRGFEEAAKENIIEIEKSADNINVLDGAIEFEVKDAESLCRLAYMTQACNRIILLIDKLKLAELKQLEDTGDNQQHGNMQNTQKKLFASFRKIRDILPKSSTFKVEIDSEGMEDKSLDIQEIAGTIGHMILEFTKDDIISKDNDVSKVNGISLNVDLKKPDITFHGCFRNDEMYIGLDLGGDMSKRDYKIFNSALSLKGTTAFCFAKMAGYNPKDNVLDTFCNSGTIEIEEALYANNISPRYYNKSMPFIKLGIIKERNVDQFFSSIDDLSESMNDNSGTTAAIIAADPLLKNVIAAKKNAKIAGVEKFIEFRRLDIDWLDLKLKEKTMDKIITFIPGSSKHIDIKKLEKTYKEFFYQSEYLLKAKGSVIILCIAKDLLIKASEGFFKMEKAVDVYSGGQKMHVLSFRSLEDKNLKKNLKKDSGIGSGKSKIAG